MKSRLFLIAILLVLTGQSINAQVNYVPTQENIEAREKFNDYRFGIFIHWGIYSMLADGEWVMYNKGINYKEYERLAAGFYPSKFNADEWVDLFKAAGARYMTITSRHHDGFSMFDSDASDYNIVDATPFKRDVIGEIADACHRKDFNLHFYYSHLDWHRTDYWPLGKTGHTVGRPEGDENSWQQYKDFMSAQLTELLTKYGKIGAIWFDGLWDMGKFSHDEQPELWGLYDQYELIHSLQPACLVGNNHHIEPFGGEDIQLFERDVPGHNDAGFSAGQEISTLPLETCETMNRTWGYNITDKDYKSVDQLITYLARTAGKGANLLLNIGPRPDGTIPDEAVERLLAMGEWLGKYGEAIYETEGGFIPEQEWGVTTQKGNVLYIHVLKHQDSIKVPMTGNKLVKAEDLITGETFKAVSAKDGVTVPVAAVEGPDHIIKLTFKKSL